jgi:hypothetical protein
VVLDDVPPVRLVRKELGEDLGFWAPLVGVTMEREPVVEQYLRNLVVGRGRSEKTTKDYAGWLVPAIGMSSRPSTCSLTGTCARRWG